MTGSTCATSSSGEAGGRLHDMHVSRSAAVDGHPQAEGRCEADVGDGSMAQATGRFRSPPAEEEGFACVPQAGMGGNRVLVGRACTGRFRARSLNWRAWLGKTWRCRGGPWFRKLWPARHQIPFIFIHHATPSLNPRDTTPSRRRTPRPRQARKRPPPPALPRSPLLPAARTE